MWLSSAQYLMSYAYTGVWCMRLKKNEPKEFMNIHEKVRKRWLLLLLYCYDIRLLWLPFADARCFRLFILLEFCAWWCVCVCALDMLLFTRWMPLQKFRMISSCEQFRCNIRWYKRRFTTLHWRWAVEMQRTSCVYVLIIFICTNCAQSQRCG